MMHSWLIIVLLFSSIDSGSRSSEQLTSGPTGNRKTIPLKFKPVRHHLLKRAQPKSTWKRVKTVRVEGIQGKSDVSIDLYVESVGEGPEETYAFLEDNQILYEIGTVSSFGADDVVIQATERFPNHEKQWEIYGALGAAADSLIIIGFDRGRKRWISLLNESSNSTEQLDLDGDGEKEIVARFGAAADLTIYRWRQNHFESAILAHTLGADFAYKILINGKWVIQSGKIINGESQVLHRFEYSKGQLVELGFR